MWARSVLSLKLSLPTASMEFTRPFTPFLLMISIFASSRYRVTVTWILPLSLVNLSAFERRLRTTFTDRRFAWDEEVRVIIIYRDRTKESHRGIAINGRNSRGICTKSTMGCTCPNLCLSAIKAVLYCQLPCPLYPLIALYGWVYW